MNEPHEPLQFKAVYDDPIRVVVRPARNTGWFEVYTRKSRLCISQFPIRDTARGLLVRGHLPEAPIIIQNEFPWPVTITTLGEAAQSVEIRGFNIVVFGSRS